MSKRARERLVRERRTPGVWWLPRPVLLVPGQGTVRVVGVTRDAAHSLYRWWEAESRARGIDHTDTRKAA
jgi:hypothetical protein